MKTVFIYALKDPETNRIYIGKSNRPAKRFQEHLRDRDKSFKGNWIRALIARNLKPELEIVDEVVESEWRAAEAAYIQFYREAGHQLVNGTCGGDGADRGEKNPNWKKGLPGAKNGMYGKMHRIESRVKQSLAKKGKQLSIKHRSNISAAVCNKIKRSNTSGFVGAAWDRSRGKWLSNVRVGGHKKYIGRFAKLEDAVFAYRLWLDIHKASVAPLHFI